MHSHQKIRSMSQPSIRLFGRLFGLLLMALLLQPRHMIVASAWILPSSTDHRTRGPAPYPAPYSSSSLVRIRYTTRTTLPLAAAADMDDELPSDNTKTTTAKKKRATKTKKAIKTTAANNKKKTNHAPKKRKRKKNASKKKASQNENDNNNDTEILAKAKQELVRKVGAQMAETAAASEAVADTSSTTTKTTPLVDRFNPFKAGQQLRQTIDTALTSMNRPPAQESMYYLDDRLSTTTSTSKSASTSSSTSSISWDDDYEPEVLVVNALSEIGTRVVQRLVRGTQGKFRVRVLVPDLYTDTLQTFGTRVSYQPGSVENVESLEYALTDVDKIVYCPASAASEEEDDDNAADKVDDDTTTEQQQQQRARRAEANDCWGVKHVVQAYQNVRHADYGTSQAAKRTLFKFGRRLQDFHLFAVMVDDDDDVDDDNENIDKENDDRLLEDDDDDMLEEDGEDHVPRDDDTYDDEDYDKYDEDGYENEYDDDDDDEYYDDLEQQDASTLTTTQVQWIRNKFDHAVFVGRLTAEAQAAVMSGRLRSREKPDQGIDLSGAFAGFILRVCSDGRTYQAFVRTSLYETDGIEYVCRFSTESKNEQPTRNNNKSRNKFTTVRLPFEDFEPVVVVTSSSSSSNKVEEGGDNADQSATTLDEMSDIPDFVGQDVQHIGFRHVAEPAAADSSALDSSSPTAAALLAAAQSSKQQQSTTPLLQPFYLAFSYIKLYRSQPEPEIVYVSDALVPPVVHPNRVRHDLKRLLLEDEEDSGGTVLLDDRTDSSNDGKSQNSRSSSTPEEVYFKYVGEELIKRSGLAYAIVRVQDDVLLPDDEKDTRGAVTEIALAASPPDNNNGSLTVSQDQVAQVCVSALLDPNALNKAVYLYATNDQSETSLSDQFQAIPR